MGVPILGGWGGSDNVGKIPTFYRFLFWRTSLRDTITEVIGKNDLSPNLSKLSLSSMSS